MLDAGVETSWIQIICARFYKMASLLIILQVVACSISFLLMTNLTNTKIQVSVNTKKMQHHWSEMMIQKEKSDACSRYLQMHTDNEAPK